MITQTQHRRKPHSFLSSLGSQIPHSPTASFEVGIDTDYATLIMQSVITRLQSSTLETLRLKDLTEMFEQYSP